MCSVSGVIAFFSHVCLPHMPCMLAQEGKSVKVPVYNFATHKRSHETRHVEPADVIILEGGSGTAGVVGTLIEWTAWFVRLLDAGMPILD